MHFREWLKTLKPSQTEAEVVSNYLHNTHTPVNELIRQSGKSTGDFYRLLRANGIGNRHRSNHENVHSFAKTGLTTNQIADYTGYSPRNIRYILKKQ